MRTSPLSAAIRHYLFAVAGYALASLVIMAPVLPQITSAIPGGAVAAVDGWQNVWNLWWVQQALATGRNPFFSDMIFYPQGVSLALQTLGISNGVLVLPVTALWGPTAGYNAAVLLALALSGLAGYALALEVSGERRASFLAGLIFTCSPYHLTRVYDGQLELITLQWPTFYALFLVRALTRRSSRDALVAGLFLALTGYTSLYYLIFMGLFSLAAVALWGWPPHPPAPSPVAEGHGRRGWGVRANRLLPALIAGLTGLLLLLPLLLPALANATGRSGGVVNIADTEIVNRSSNLIDVVLPSYLHPLWGQALFVAVSSSWHDYSGDWNAALGYGVLALAILGAATSWRSAWRWWLIAGIAVLFALGPQLRVGTWRTGLPLPYVLLDALPGLSLGRRPALFIALVTIALIPPLALGLRALEPRGRQRRPWPLILALGIVGFELLPRPWPLLSAAVHPYYRELAGRPGALMEVPPARYKNSLPQLAQTVHGRPLFGGYLARSPVYPLAKEAPWLSALWELRLPGGPLLVDGMTDPLAALSYYQVGDVLIRWDRLDEGQRETALALMELALPGAVPAYADESIRVYHVPSAPPRPFASLVEAGWEPLEHDAVSSWRWMHDTGTMLIVNPGEAPLPITISMRAYGYVGPREVRMTLDGFALGIWNVGAGDTGAAFYLWLPAGEHRLVLQAPTEHEAIRNSGRWLSIALLDARITASGYGVQP